jgi:hypothetical protein
MPKDLSPLGPIHPASIPDEEQEKSAPWIVRKLVEVSRFNVVCGGPNGAAHA